MDPGVDELVGALRAAAHAVRSVTTSTADELRALVQARDAVEAAMAERLAELEQTQGYVAEDASSVSTWARRELRQDARRTRQLITAAGTMCELPQVGEAARAGRISIDHVARFSFALAHVDPVEVRRLESHLVAVALLHPPSRVKALVDRLRAILHAEELDEAWIAGADKAHLTLNPLQDGWHVTGFLPIDVGAKLKVVLDAVSVPREAGDRRSASERRIDGLDQLLARVLADGLPTDGTVRPQIHVIVDAGTLQRALAPGAESALERVRAGRAGRPARLRPHRTEPAGAPDLRRRPDSGPGRPHRTEPHRPGCRPSSPGRHREATPRGLGATRRPLRHRPLPPQHRPRPPPQTVVRRRPHRLGQPRRTLHRLPPPHPPPRHRPGESRLNPATVMSDSRENCCRG
ncbi:DUF222 domain-containing protein [Aeromicrobium sp. 636]|uniref:DUF222 domain-containing protein n=1 Tax=Aeromicrobium senzhongii TaxID=2663859 RepID=A0A8I0ESY1_9ACTN|nr:MULTISPECIES: DUF222 domain-containing protein [Aeromicrobium]MBC9225600.1 DUF222 domain-containing protein [Aeromicrobium senzhongii]MCQ3997709.1 DUF222 domain-containing protein [Aeromicrobium sp. 636]